MTGPYIFEIKNAEQRLLFFGVRHSRNINDEQWSTLKTEWNNFAGRSGGKKVVFFEGPQFSIPHGLSAEEQIKKYGEAGFLLTLVGTQSAGLHWPEITMQEEFGELVKKFDSDLVEYFIFVRTAGAWLNGGAHGNFDETINRAARATARSIGSSEEVSYYSGIHQRIFGVPLAEKEAQVLVRAAAPVYHDSIVNEIGRASNEIRDDRLASEVHKYWADGYSIFVLFGSHHAKSLEGRLRKELAGE